MNVADSVDLLASPFVQGRTTRVRQHRPWPMPHRRWVMAQTWMDLLFAHWEVEPEALERVVPRQLPLDTRDGRAWIGVTPFAVRNLRLRVTLPVPYVSSFPEINVRTYVSLDGRPGIYFFSLDAGSRLAVQAARRAYRVPYFLARMDIRRHGGEIEYASERVDVGDAPPAAFRGRYRPAGEVFRAQPDTLEHWLAERYCLYTLDDDGRVLRGDIHHPPWPVQAATADIELNTMAHEVGLDLPEQPLLHYARRQDVLFWTLEPA